MWFQLIDLPPANIISMMCYFLDLFHSSAWIFIHWYICPGYCLRTKLHTNIRFSAHVSAFCLLSSAPDYKLLQTEQGELFDQWIRIMSVWFFKIFVILRLIKYTVGIWTCSAHDDKSDLKNKEWVDNNCLETDFSSIYLTHERYNLRLWKHENKSVSGPNSIYNKDL